MELYHNVLNLERLKSILESGFIYKDDRIAQLVILPYQNIIFTEVNYLSDTDRDNGGFGSTDKK